MAGILSVHKTPKLLCGLENVRRAWIHKVVSGWSIYFGWTISLKLKTLCSLLNICSLNCQNLRKASEMFEYKKLESLMTEPIKKSLCLVWRSPQDVFWLTGTVLTWYENRRGAHLISESPSTNERRPQSLNLQQNSAKVLRLLQRSSAGLFPPQTQTR